MNIQTNTPPVWNNFKGKPAGTRIALGVDSRAQLVKHAGFGMGDVLHFRPGLDDLGGHVHDGLALGPVVVRNSHPNNIRSKLLAGDDGANGARRGLDGRALLGRDPAIGTEPRPNVAPIGVATCGGKGRLPPKKLRSLKKKTLVGIDIGHFASLLSVDPNRQLSVDGSFPTTLPCGMGRDADDKVALGKRLATARQQAELSLLDVATRLTESGFKYGKAAVGAWEKGRNVPDALVLAKLAKMYATSTDALLWGNSLSTAANRIATQYDGLKAEQQRYFHSMWSGYLLEASRPAIKAVPEDADDEDLDANRKMNDAIEQSRQGGADEHYKHR